MGDNTKERGFTLVELSIVLLIIGLIIGAITAGSNLVNQGKLRSIINEQNNYFSAVQAFRLQYNYFPGDFPNASTTWPTCNATPSLCNGDGNGIILNALNANSERESLLAWQHMALAGNIPGVYDGLTQDAPCAYAKNIYWNLFSNGAQQYTLMPSSVNHLVIGNQHQSIGSIPSPFMPAPDAYSIDVKIDDGNPSNGKVLASDDNSMGGIKAADGVTSVCSQTCLSGSGSSYYYNNAMYNLTLTSMSISRLWFRLE